MQALIITAYKDIEQIKRLIKSSNKYFKLFIHIDKKSADIFDSLLKINASNTYIYSLYSVTWGGYSHLAAIIALLKIAIKHPDINYFHIISGQDMIIKNFREFVDKFEFSDKIYMTCTNISDSDSKVKERLNCWIPSANWNLKKFTIRCLVESICLIQKIFHINRKRLGFFSEIYKGMIWASMPKSVVEYVVAYISDDPTYLKDLSHTKIPEEFFLQTILMNSQYKDQIVCNNLRYTDWNSRNGSTPAILDETDYDKIINSGCFFARKIDSNISMKLIKMFEMHLK